MAAQFQFVMRSGPTPGATYSLEGDQLTIGRDSSNAVTINDAEVSRKHARMNFQGGKYVIEDLGSTNGTFVNGQRLAGPVVLKSGDVVSLGEQIVLLFESLNADLGATVAASRKSIPTPSRPAAPAPVSVSPPPPPAYSTPLAPPRKTNWVPILIGAGVLVLICACVAIGFWIDADPTGQRWCMVLPFLTGCGR